MAVDNDLEIIVHSKDQLEILIIKMDNNNKIKFCFCDPERIEESCGYKVLNNHLDDEEEDFYISIHDWEKGFILGIIDMKNNRQSILNFLNKIKVPEKDVKSTTITESNNGDLTNIYIKNLDEDTKIKVKKALIGLGIMNLKERPYYEQDPIY